MKNNFKTNIIKILISFSVYAISFGICILIIIQVPYHEYADSTREFALQIANEFADTGSLEMIDLHSFGALVYDINGECIDSQMPALPVVDGEAPDIFGPFVKNSIASVFAGGTTLKICFIPSHMLSPMIAGQPVYKDNQICYAFFLIRNTSHLYPTIKLFGLVYTIIFILAAVFFFNTLNKRQKYLQLQRDYMANFSHDLKSPIASIRALAETMSDHPVDEPGKNHEYCAFIIRESVRLEHTVLDILELSAVQSNHVDFSKTTCRLAEIFAPILEKYKILCYDMMIGFHISDKLQEIPSVRTNTKNISRLLDILLDNAVKFVGEEGEIWLNATFNFKEIVISVKDNGPGISKKDQKYIFNRFYKGDYSRNSKGSGLGLAIAWEITAALGEKIWVESEQDNGATFYFTVHFK